MKFLLVSILLSLAVGISGCSNVNKQEKTTRSTYKKSESSTISKRHINYLNGVAAAKQGKYKEAVNIIGTQFSKVILWL